MKNSLLKKVFLSICIIVYSIGAYAQVEASFNNVWLEHNTYQYTTVNQPVWNGFMWVNSYGNTSIKGMKIHINVDVFNAQGQNLTVAAFVFDEDGAPIRSLQSQYRTPDGQLTSQYRFVPQYESTSYPEGWLFLPYSAFSYPAYSNSMDCKLRVDVLDRNGYSIGQSDWYYFSITK